MIDCLLKNGSGASAIRNFALRSSVWWIKTGTGCKMGEVIPFPRSKRQRHTRNLIVGKNDT